MEGNSTTPKNCALTNFLIERSKVFFLVFSLIRFWIFVRNDNNAEGMNDIKYFSTMIIPNKNSKSYQWEDQKENYTPFIQKICQNTIFGSSRISFHFLNSIFQGSRFSFQFLNSIFQGSRISFRFLNFCQECYYFQKLVGVVVFTKVRGPFGSLDLCKNYYSH